MMDPQYSTQKKTNKEKPLHLKILVSIFKASEYFRSDIEQNLIHVAPVHSTDKKEQ